MTTNILSFAETFKNKIFRIPDYQRGYSWGEEEIKMFWNDLNNARINKKVHFTGVITVNNFSDSDIQNLLLEGFLVNNINNENNTLLINDEVYELCNIVDGQQRFTTILILLFCLIKKLKDTEREDILLKKYFRKPINGTNNYFFGYHIDVPSRNYLVHNIFEDEAMNREEKETLYTHNLQSAKAYFFE